MKNEFFGHLRDNPLVRYAVKHLQESNFQLHGHVYTDHYRDGNLIDRCDQGSNTFTTLGMAYLLNVIFGNTSKPGAAIFYLGIFKNNVTPGLADTPAVCLGAAGTYGECQDADYKLPLTDKPSYVIAATSTATCTNAASVAGFTMAGPLTVYGAFLSTEKAKTATSGTLMCAKKFSSSRQVVDNDVLAVTYTTTCTTS